MKSENSLHDLYLRVSYLLTIATGALIATTLAGTALLFPGGYPDPFTPYDVIMPGQPATSLNSLACIQDYPPSSPDTYVCRGNPGDERIFKRIQVVAYEGAISQITFYGESLQVLDLIRHFGNPNAISLEKRHYLLIWDDGTFAFIPISARRYANQLRVLFVTQGAKLKPPIH